MKNKKGISMISLVITIIVIVILVGIATTAGYKYIIEGNKMKAEAVVTVISEAAYRRQNDLSSGVAVAYYEGYSFVVDSDNNESRYEKIKGLPEGDLIKTDGTTGADGIPDCLQEVGAKWYLFDVESANALGVKESERFITRNISYPAGLKEEEVKLVLADYSSGKGYYIEMPTELVADSIRENEGCMNSPTGKHNYKIIATCTTPALCIYCGEADPLNPALGHSFTDPTCTASGICRRCNAVDPDNGPLGHLMITNADISNTTLVEKLNARECRIYPNRENGALADSDEVSAWITDALKHWHECVRCGERLEEQDHTLGNVDLDSEYHYSVCSVCGWNSIKAKHVYSYQSISDNKHSRKCKVCFHYEEHDDSGWLADHPTYHYRICKVNENCYDELLVIGGKETKVLFKEAHYDLNDDLFCDLCGRALDSEPPKPFAPDSEYYGKTIDTDTDSITVEAFTKDDGVGVDYYQFGILNPETGEIEWGEKQYPTNQTFSVQYTFNNLKPNTEYTIYVKATDKAGNINEPYKIPGAKTDGFPTFNGLTDIPETYVKGPVDIGFAPVETEMTDLSIKYTTDDGKTWTEVPLEDFDTEKITISKEKEVIQIKFVDPAGNESDVYEYTIEKIDTTPPTVTIEAKEGDNSQELASYHTAKVTISDEKSGIAPDTNVKYAWSTSNTIPPTEFEELNTKNYENASKVSVEIKTPSKVKGDYYLWILEGVEDRVGNATTKPVCSSMYFKIDDEEIEASNIKMENVAPLVDSQSLFVNTDGVVTISFNTNKKLGQDPIVTLNGKNVTMKSIDGLAHVGTIKISDAFDEGTLELSIANLVSETGKVNSTTYSNKDLVVGPVYYDKTLPVFEYISKQ